MEKVRPWCGQLSDRGRLTNRKQHKKAIADITACLRFSAAPGDSLSGRPYRVAFACMANC